LTKNSKETMMKDEIKVLNIMEQYARESVDEIAKRCGFSRQKVWRIIKNLDENKIIWGYSAIADGTLRDLKHYVLLCKRSMVPLDNSMKKEVVVEKLDDHLPNLVKIDDIFLTHGSYNGVVTFYALTLLLQKR